MAKLLRKYGKDGRNSPVVLQSFFEPTSIQRLNRLVDNPLVVLLSSAGSRPFDFVEANDPRTVADLITPRGCARSPATPRASAPPLDLIIPRKADGSLAEPTTLVSDAHKVGLILHPYTLRNENPFPPAEYRKV